MRRNISTLTTGQVKDILAVAPRKVAQLVDDGQLKGGRLPGSKDRRINLIDLIDFIDKHNFPRTRLLRFLEEHGATKAELGEWGIDSITEPIGTGDIRFYPKIPPYSKPENTPDILTSGKIAKLVNCAPRTVAKWADQRSLNHYKIGSDRRITADDFYRFWIKYGQLIPPELENKTALSMNYPGGWQEGDQLKSQPNKSLWYRRYGKEQEISVRYENDGLYIRVLKNAQFEDIQNSIIELIVLGLTGREEQGKILRDYHVNFIYECLENGIKLSDQLQAGKMKTAINDICKYSQEKMKLYLPKK